MRYKIILFMLAFLLVGSVMASSSTLGIFKKNTSIELKQTCVINGSFCDSCNISSVDYPDGDRAISDVVMTKRTGDFNYTLDSSNTTKLGTYRVNGYCQWNDVLKNWVYSFKITTTGQELGGAESTIYIVWLIAMLFTFILCFYGAIKIPFRNVRDERGMLVSINDMKYLKIFLIVTCYILLMFIFGVTRSIMENYLFINGAYRVFNWLFWIMFSLVWPTIVLSVLFTVILYLNSKKIKEALERGIPF